MNLTKLNKLIKITDANATELREKVLGYGLDPEGKSRKQMETMISMAQFAEEHPGEEFPNQFDPMLAEDSTMADPDWIDKTYNSEDWVIQEKKNGLYSVWVLNPDGSVQMTSRSKSVKNQMFTPHHENVLGFKSLKSPFKGKTVLAGELMAPKSKVKLPSGITTESPLQAVVALIHMNTSDSLKIQEDIGSLQYHVFDILYFDGKNVQDLPYEERDELADTAIALILEENTELPLFPIETHKDYKSAYAIYKKFAEEGAEGIMMKKKKGKYKQGTRSKDIQKLKGFVTVDGYITGMVEANQEKGFKGLIGGFRISALVEGVETEIASVSNIPRDVREDATLVKDGVPTLNPKYINKVVELKGQEFGKNKRLGSARINEWRPDKDPEDCKLTKEEIMPKDWGE